MRRRDEFSAPDSAQQAVDGLGPEADTTLPQTGFIGLQIHGGGKAQVFFKDIRIRELGRKAP